MKRSGFTLVELAIVLVVIGLLVGSILTGQELIEQGRIVKVINELENLKRGYLTFRAKYDALPGDMKNATAIFGSADGNGNGNGDNVYDDPIYNGIYNYGYYYYENSLAIKHLSYAQLIAFTPTGNVFTNPASDLIPLASVPQARSNQGGVLSTSGYSFGNTVGAISNGLGTTRAYIGNALIIHCINPAPTQPYAFEQIYLSDGCILRETAYRLDKKLDDGKPLTGVVKAASGGFMGGSCIVNTAGVVDYNLTDTGQNCLPFYYLP